MENRIFCLPCFAMGTWERERDSDRRCIPNFQFHPRSELTTRVKDLSGSSRRQEIDNSDSRGSPHDQKSEPVNFVPWSKRFRRWSPRNHF
ncbi:hypothetical protein ACLOJK_017138 [Asimina triloba]